MTKLQTKKSYKGGFYLDSFKSNGLSIECSLLEDSWLGHGEDLPICTELQRNRDIAI